MAWNGVMCQEELPGLVGFGLSACARCGNDDVMKGCFSSVCILEISAREKLPFTGPGLGDKTISRYHDDWTATCPA